MTTVKVNLPVPDMHGEETDTRKIEKRRSWREITSSASSVADASAEEDRRKLAEAIELRVAQEAIKEQKARKQRNFEGVLVVVVLVLGALIASISG